MATLTQLATEFATQMATLKNSNTSWISSAWDMNPSNVRQYQMNETSLDLLVLSATFYRLRQTGKANGIETMLSNQVFNSVTFDDQVNAETIRDHFSKKLMLLALREVPLTPFREDLRKFISSSGMQFTDAIIPMVFRLPEFYRYDLEFAELKTEFDAQLAPLRSTVRNTRTLAPVKELNRKLKSGFRHEYWFKDDTGRAVLNILNPTDQCKSLWDREFNKGEVMAFNGTFVPLIQDDLPYLKMTKWTIE